MGFSMAVAIFLSIPKKFFHETDRACTSKSFPRAPWAKNKTASPNGQDNRPNRSLQCPFQGLPVKNIPFDKFYVRMATPWTTGQFLKGPPHGTHGITCFKQHRNQAASHITGGPGNQNRLGILQRHLFLVSSVIAQLQCNRMRV